MLSYLLKRLAGVVVVALGVLTITFFLVSMIPSDVAVFYAGPHASGQEIANMRHVLGLDQPKYVQYVKYLWQTFQGNLGESATLDEPVSTALWQRLPQTAILAGAVILIEMVVMFIVGVLSSLYEESWFDRGAAGLAALGVSAPSFWLGTMLLFLIGYKLDLLPLGGYGDPLISYLILPVVTAGVPSGFWYARILRASLLETLHADYIRTARSKGLRRRGVIVRHALPNAIVPVLTIAAMDLGQMLGNLVVIQTVFSWPGIGLLAYQGMQNLDLPLIIGSTLFTALCIAVLNILADLLRILIDPRIRLA
jgi:peptide/nickel transport system permease protein